MRRSKPIGAKLSSATRCFSIAAAVSICIFGGESAKAVGLTYVDADPLATMNLNPPGAVIFTNGNSDGFWGQRTFGAVNVTNAKTIYEAGITEDVPEISQTVSGLTPGSSYDLYVVYWNDFTDWRIQAGTVSGSLAYFNQYGPTVELPAAQAGTSASTVPWDVPPVDPSATPLFYESNRTMFVALVGTAIADGSGNATVFLDDTPLAGSNARTWLDGVAYAPAGTQVFFSPGDFNRSGGALDAVDYQVLLNNLYTDVSALPFQSTYLMGDINLDHLIDYFDLNQFAANYDMQNGSGSFAAMTATVPEPSPVLLALFGGVLMVTAKWHRHICNGYSSLSMGCAPNCLVLAVTLSILVGLDSSRVATAAAVTGWAKDTSFGGGNTAALTNELTNSPTLGNGTADNANNTAIWATLPDTTLSPGQQIVLTGSVDIIGGRVFSSAENAFRFGLFSSNGSGNTFGWLGYWASNSAAGRNGTLSSRETDGTNFGAVTFASTTNGRAKLLAVGGNNALVENGTYTFNLTVGRFDDASTTAYATLTSPAGYNMEIYHATETDPTNFIFDYNRVGFLSASSVLSDQLQFHDVDVAVQSISAPTLKITADGGVSIVNTSGAPLNLAYYEITSTGGMLNPGGWTTIDSTEADPLGAGWDVPANTSPTLLAENYLDSQNANSLAPGASISLGNAAQMDASDLRFYYGLPGGGLYRGFVQYEGPAVPGDFDSDGDVDGADFIAWQTNYPAASGHTLATGDSDGDGDVDGADFAAWQSGFPTAPGGGATPVPEPSAYMLAIGALVGLGICWRRRTGS